MVKYRFRKFLTYYFQWLADKVLSQSGAIEHSLWEGSPLMSPSRLRIITSRYCEGKFFSLFFSCKGIVKKQSFKSITIRGHSFGNREGRGIQDCRGPLG